MTEIIQVRWSLDRGLGAGYHADADKTSGPGCSKLTVSLVNVSLIFQTFISEICQYFLLKKCEKLLHCLQKRLSFFQQKISASLDIKS